MKLRTTAVFAFLFMMLTVFSCESDEQFVTKEAGLWNVTSLSTQVYENGDLISDETHTDSLGQMQFNMTGQGFKFNANMVVDTFVWALNGENNRLVVYYKVGPWMNASIESRTDTEMKLFWENETAEGAVIRKYSHTSTIRRAQ